MAAIDIVSILQQALDREVETKFRRDYSDYAKKLGLSPDPDDPLHYYDYRSAWSAGEMKPDSAGHLSSKYKRPGHPRYYVSPDGKRGSSKPVRGWLNTVTGEIVK